MVKSLALTLLAKLARPTGVSSAVINPFKDIQPGVKLTATHWKCRRTALFNCLE